MALNIPAIPGNWRSDGPLDLASEIVFDGVDRLSLLQDVDLSNPAAGDLLSWDGFRWINISQSAITPDLSDYVRWESLADYVTDQELLDILSLLPSEAEVSSLSGRVSDLEQAQFFELDGRGNVKLKDEYGGLYANGFISSGGIGSDGGGGGGLITSVKGVADLGTAIPTESLTETFSAKAIETIWEAVLDLQEQGATNVTLVNGASYSTLTVNGVSADFYTKAQVDSLMANIDLSDYVTTEAMATALAGVNTLETITTNQDGTLDFTWKDGDIVKVDLNHGHSNYVPKSLTINGVDLSQNRTFYVGTSPIQATAQAQNLTGILSIKAVASNTSMLVWDNDHGAWRVMGNLYADGWVAAGGIGSGSGGGGGIDLDRMWQSLTNNTDKPNVEINIAHIPTLTAAKIPDITTAKVSDINTWVTSKGLSIAGLSVNIGGSITAAALRQALGISGDETPTISSVVLTNGANYSEITVDDTSASFYTKAQIDSALGNFVTIAGGQTITGAKTFSAWLTASGGIITGGDIYPSTDLGGSLGYSTRRFSNLNVREISTGGINFKSSDNSDTTGYLSFQAGYMILRSGSNIGSSYKQLTFHESYGFYPDSTGVNLGYSGASNRWQTIYGVNADLTGDLSLASSSHIDIGPLRIEYDATNKALHITKKDSNDTETYGLYADGFVSAGGVQQTS